MTQLKDAFSVMPGELESIRHFLNVMLADISNRFPDTRNPEEAEPSKLECYEDNGIKYREYRTLRDF